MTKEQNARLVDAVRRETRDEVAFLNFVAEHCGLAGYAKIATNRADVSRFQVDVSDLEAGR